MKVFQNLSELQEEILSCLNTSTSPATVTDEKALVSSVIDSLVYSALFSDEKEVKELARKLIREAAQALGIASSSIHELYRAIGQGEASGFTVPAMNIRAMTYDTAQIVFELAKNMNAGAFIFEIARSEIQYTDQRPDEYAVVILAAAIKSGWRGPVFIQGDHFQFSKSKYGKDPAAETQVIKDLIKESLDADFQNIDIDASTLVDLEKKELDAQQEHNFKVTAELTRYIRDLETNGTVSIGGEIGHIGGVNSSVADFEAFMNGYIKDLGEKVPGISKVSVQTGTSHGGVVLPDGSIQKVSIDMNVLREISRVARKKYGMGGSVQHGASTLPTDLFSEFPKMDTLEIHLATGFQNIVYDTMPQELKDKMYAWVRENLKEEWEEGWNEEQFIYKTRKKAIGPFKKDLWMLSDAEKKPIRDGLSAQFQLLFTKLNIKDTADIVSKYIK